MRTLSTCLMTAAVLSQVGATDCGNALRDPGFDLWCGEDLCAWKVTRGEIKRVATWHEGDAGVELVGTDAAIQQLSPVDSSDGHCRDQEDGGVKCTYPDDVCLEFSLLANIDDRAVVDLNVDVIGDGSIDHTQRLPIGKWQALAYKIRIRQPFAGVRFELAKAGPGVAQLANIGARLARNCDGLPLIDPRPTPLGAPCQEDADCASGTCGIHEGPEPFDGVNGFLSPNRVCLACDAARPCGAGTTCGLSDAVSPVRAVPTACVAEGSRELGEQCAVDRYDATLQRWVSECATGYCTLWMCSTCDDSPTGNRPTGCAASETCGQAWVDPAATVFMYAPSVCSPSAHVRLAGEPCASDDDCASASCAGAERKQCNDGRECVSPSQCPFEDGLKNGPCTTVGIQGGTCQ